MTDQLFQTDLFTTEHGPRCAVCNGEHDTAACWAGEAPTLALSLDVIEDHCPECGYYASECECIDGPGGERRCEECGESFNREEQDRDDLCIHCELREEDSSQ